MDSTKDLSINNNKTIIARGIKTQEHKKEIIEIANFDDGSRTTDEPMELKPTVIQINTTGFEEEAVHNESIELNFEDNKKM